MPLARLRAAGPTFDVGLQRALDAIAKTHNATIFQIALAWVISQPRVITIPMSFNPQHIKENFEAAETQLSPNEIEQLTNQ